MNEYRILTPGEKIKDIRNRFDIRQEDITGGEITRNLISIIENNKANLTEDVARILVISINNICKERNINFSVTTEYLLESVVSQAKRIADDYMQFIENLSKNDIIDIPEKLNEINVFLKGYETEEKKTVLYRSIAKKFMEIRLYSKAMDYYLKAYESSTNNKVTTNLLINLGMCCTYLSQYNDAINYYNLLLELNNDIQPAYLAKFNIALCHKKIGKYNEALEYLYDIQKNFKIIKPTHIKEFDTNILIGTCLHNLKSFNKAVNIYKVLLKNVQSIDEEMLVLSNLADVYKETKDYNKLKKICDKILNKTNDSDVELKFINEYEGDIYLDLSKNFITLGDQETATGLLLKALESYKNGQSTLYQDDLDDLIINILNIYIKNNNEVGIDFIKNEFFELIKKGLYPKYNKASLIFIQYYTNTKNPDKVNSIVDFLAS